MLRDSAIFCSIFQTARLEDGSAHEELAALFNVSSKCTYFVNLLDALKKINLVVLETRRLMDAVWQFLNVIILSY